MDWRAFSETFVTLLVIMDPVGTAPIFVALTAGRPSRERRETSGAGSPAVQPTAKSSAYTVPWAYQPCTKTVTLVVPAPVLNGTLSLVKVDADGLNVETSPVPVPLTPMKA